MQKAVKLILIIAALTMVFPTVSITAQTANIFSVMPVLPENQSPESLGSFNLDVKAGESQNLEILIENHSDDFITLEISIINPGTNRRGVIDYSQSGEMDKTLKASFSDIAHPSVDPIVTISAGETERFPIALEIPENGFDGVLLGAIRVLLLSSEGKAPQAEQDKDHTAHVIPVRLFQNRNTVITPRFELGDISFGLIAEVAAIEVKIRNPEPRFSVAATVDAQIFPTGGDTPIFTVTNLEVDFAPHSVYPLTFLDTAGFGIPAGDYIANIQVVFEGQSRNFEQSFHITPEDSIAVNSSAINQLSPPRQPLDNATLSNMILWVISGAVGITIILCIVVIALVKAKAKRRFYPFRKETT